jgi:hypothetical protein
MRQSQSQGEDEESVGNRENMAAVRESFHSRKSFFLSFFPPFFLRRAVREYDELRTQRRSGSIAKPASGRIGSEGFRSLWVVALILKFKTGDDSGIHVLGPIWRGFGSFGRHIEVSPARM